MADVFAGTNMDENSSNAATNQLSLSTPIPAPPVLCIVNYVPDLWDTAKFSSFFEPYSPIDVHLTRKVDGVGHRGYGFVNFATFDLAEKAINSLNGSTVDGKRLKVTLAKPREETRVNTNVYVAGLPPTITEESLKQIMKQFGQVLEVKLLTDAAARLKHATLSGFVRFSRRTESDASIAALHETQMNADGTRRFLSPDGEETPPVGQVYLIRTSYASDHRTREKERSGQWAPDPSRPNGKDDRKDVGAGELRTRLSSDTSQQSVSPALTPTVMSSNGFLPLSPHLLGHVGQSKNLPGTQGSNSTLPTSTPQAQQYAGYGLTGGQGFYPSQVPLPTAQSHSRSQPISISTHGVQMYPGFSHSSPPYFGVPPYDAFVSGAHTHSITHPGMNQPSPTSTHSQLLNSSQSLPHHVNHSPWMNDGGMVVNQIHSLHDAHLSASQTAGSNVHNFRNYPPTSIHTNNSASTHPTHHNGSHSIIPPQSMQIHNGSTLNHSGYTVQSNGRTGIHPASMNAHTGIGAHIGAFSVPSGLQHSMNPFGHFDSDVSSSAATAANSASTAANSLTQTLGGSSDEGSMPLSFQWPDISSLVSSMDGTNSGQVSMIPSEPVAISEKSGLDDASSSSSAVNDDRKLWNAPGIDSMFNDRAVDSSRAYFRS